MPTRLLVTFVAGVCAAAAVGCSGSTSPKGPSLQDYASHFDSLAVVACPPPFAGPQAPSCPFVSSAHLGVSEGVMPSHIQVTTKDGTADWLAWALVTQSPGRQPGTLDSTFSVVAYDGLDLKSGVLSEGVPEIMIDTTVWSSQFYPDSLSGTGVITGVGSPCTVGDTTTGRRPEFPPQVCTRVTIQASLHLTVGSQTVTIAPQSMNGFILDTAAVHYARSFGKVR